MTAVAKPRMRVRADGAGGYQVSTPNLPAIMPSQPSVGAAYMQGDRWGGGGESPFFFGWTPVLRDGRDDTRAGYVKAAARTIDAIHNSGWLAGMVRQSIASTIGAGLALAAKPDARLFGSGDQARKSADEWSQEAEARFEDWANDPRECDAGGKHTLGQMTEAGLRSNYAYGEILALLPLIDRPESQTRVKLKLLPPHKLTQDTDGQRLFQGVFHGNWDFPIGYRINLRVGQAWEEPVNIPATDAYGRRQVLHIFNGEIGTVRGISEFAPALRVVRQFDQAQDATISTLLLQTIFAATYESDAPTADILAALQDPEEQGVPGGNLEGYLAARMGFQRGTNIDLGRHGKIAHLFPGEKLKFNASKTPNDNYKAFSTMLLREICRCVGMMYEEGTGDFGGATYASINMASALNWPITIMRRKNVAVPLVQPVYEAWLEEEVCTGRMQFPGGVDTFLAKRREASRANWRGPPKAQGDWLKAAKAYELLRDQGVITDEEICADLGNDWEEVYKQRAREMARRKELKLPETDAAGRAKDTLTEQLLAEPDKPAGGV